MRSMSIRMLHLKFEGYNCNLRFVRIQYIRSFADVLVLIDQFFGEFIAMETIFGDSLQSTATSSKVK